MKRQVWYKAIDPYYSDQLQTFIGVDAEDLDHQQYEFEKWLGREHPAGIRYIYEGITVYDNSESEFMQEYYRQKMAEYIKSKNNNYDDNNRRSKRTL